MKKRSSTSFYEFETALVSLLNRLYAHFQKCVQTGQPFGLCIVNPKNASVGFPSKTIQADLERQATEYFQPTSASDYYLKYWTPPMLPIAEGNQKVATADDYQMIFELPQFDEEWQKSRLARDLIYCPSNVKSTSIPQKKCCGG